MRRNKTPPHSQKQTYVFTNCPLAKIHICFSFSFISIYCNYIMNDIILVSQKEMGWVIYVLLVHMIWKIEIFDNVQYTKRNKASSKKYSIWGNVVYFYIKATGLFWKKQACVNYVSFQISLLTRSQITSHRPYGLHKLQLNRVLCFSAKMLYALFIVRCRNGIWPFPQSSGDPRFFNRVTFIPVSLWFQKGSVCSGLCFSLS